MASQEKRYGSCCRRKSVFQSGSANEAEFRANLRKDPLSANPAVVPAQDERNHAERIRLKFSSDASWRFMQGCRERVSRVRLLK
jgi:hypothetical protein